MKFQELITARQSTRKYMDKPLDRALIDQCIDAALLAPSASNSQPWRFIVVDDPQLVQKVAIEAVGPMQSFNKFVPEAPALIAITVEKMNLITSVAARLKDREFPLIDIGIAAEHFCLQATELGLGTCMLGWFNESKVKKLLNIPKKKKIALLISLGYPPENYRQRKKIRKERNEVVGYNGY